MGKYIRLWRLADQHLEFGCALMAGIYLGTVNRTWIFWWGVAVVLLSIATFITNEMVDKEDVDRFSWNKVHAKKGENFNPLIVGLMWWLFVLAGLLLAWILGVLYWAGVMLLIGEIYSRPPMRLKNRFLFDILAQMAVWWWIPFGAPLVYFSGWNGVGIVFMTVLSLMIWGFYYPYQLSDFSADKKAGLAGTHVVVGMRKSMMLGMGMLVAGMAAYFMLGLYDGREWSLVFPLISLVALGHYLYWQRINSVDRQERLMQTYVVYMKPVSWLLIPYLAYWLVGR